MHVYTENLEVIHNRVLHTVIKFWISAVSEGFRDVAENLGKTKTACSAAFSSGPRSFIIGKVLEGFPFGFENFRLCGIRAFTQFDRALGEVIRGLPVSVSLRQNEERFARISGDKPFVRYGKRIKKTIRRFQERLHLDGRKWTHKAPFRNAAGGFYKNVFSVRLLDYFESVFRTLLEAESAALDRFAEPDDFEALLTRIGAVQSEAENSLRGILREVTDEFQSALDKAGTFELPARRFSPVRMRRRYAAEKRRREKRFAQWKNTSLAAADRDRYHLELRRLSLENEEGINSHLAELDSRMMKHIDPILGRIREKTLSVRDDIASASGKEKDIIDILSAQHVHVQKFLLEGEAAELSEAVARQSFPLFLDNFLDDLKAPFQHLPRNLILTPGQNLLRPLKNRELEKFSPYDLVTFDILPLVAKVIAENRSFFFDSIQSLLTEINEFCNVIIYNLEAGISAQSEGRDAAETVAREGVERALRGFDEAVQKLQKNLAEFKANFTELGSTVDRRLQVLMGIHRIAEIRFRIQSSLLKARGREIRRAAAGKIKTLLPQIFSRMRNIAGKLIGSYRAYRKRIGLSSEKINVSSQIADFLAETKTALEKLPFVYQRLFAALPLEEERFFKDRPEESAALHTAVENWEKQRFASTVLVAEKGMGVTTFINLYLKNSPVRKPVIRLEVPEGTTTEADIVRLIMNGLSGSIQFKVPGTVRTFEELGERLRNAPVRMVVIMENIQQMFLRVFGGNDCLRRFLVMVSETNGNVFWLLSCTLYAWEYLNKIFTVGDLVAYTIYLSPFNQKQLEDIIMLRHRMSGYLLRFEPLTALTRTLRYKRLSREKREEAARQEYFKQLFNHTRSNVHLALLYWLRSARDVSRDAITIGMMENLDLSFLSSLSDSKKFLLYELLLHDGLRLQEAVSVLRKPEESVKYELMVLKDDGIVVRDGDVYGINPLVYRQAVTLLQEKNLVH